MNIDGVPFGWRHEMIFPVMVTGVSIEATGGIIVTARPTLTIPYTTPIYSGTQQRYNIDTGMYEDADDGLDFPGDGTDNYLFELNNNLLSGFPFLAWVRYRADLDGVPAYEFVERGASPPGGPFSGVAVNFDSFSGAGGYAATLLTGPYDTDGYFTSGTAITIPFNGYYEVGVSIQWAWNFLAPSEGTAKIVTRLNGVANIAYPQTEQHIYTNTGFLSVVLTPSKTVLLGAGDVIEFYPQQSLDSSGQITAGVAWVDLKALS